MQYNGFLGSHFFLVNYDSPVNGRNISGESLFPKRSHYLLINNDRGSHYLLVKNDRGGGGGHFFRGVIFHGYTGWTKLCAFTFFLTKRRYRNRHNDSSFLMLYKIRIIFNPSCATLTLVFAINKKLFANCCSSLLSIILRKCVPLPIPQNDEVVSHPVKECKNRRHWHISSPSTFL